MNPLLIGGHPALDFLNTAFTPQGEPVEVIGDGKALLGWLAAAGLLGEAEGAKLARRVGAKGMDEVAAEARKLREWGRAWLGRWRTEPDRDNSAEIAVLNRLLAHQASHRAVVSTPKGLQLTERASVQSGEALLGLLATQLALLVTREDARLVRSCAGSGCTLWFLDRTKAHRRLFCSAAACGNRARVAAFRQRQRAE